MSNILKGWYEHVNKSYFFSLLLGENVCFFYEVYFANLEEENKILSTSWMTYKKIATHKSIINFFTWKHLKVHMYLQTYTHTSKV